MSFYKKNKGRYGNFEVVHVSFDNSEDAMVDYMKDSKMDFPGLGPKVRGKTSAPDYAGRGIPCFSVVDKDGKVVVDGRSMNARQALEKFGDVLQSSKKKEEG